MFNPTPILWKDIINELKKMKEFNHPNIVTFYGVINNSFSIVTEFIYGSNYFFIFIINLI